MNMMEQFRKYSLALAESFDAWRIVPRAILIVYSALVLNLYLWFRSIPTFVQERCDAGMLKLLLDQGINIEQAKLMACTIVDVVGGPTAAQSAFVTTITGLSAGIFGLYTATGRRWDGGLPEDINRRFVYDSPSPEPTPPQPTKKKSKLDEPPQKNVDADEAAPRLTDGADDGMSDDSVPQDNGPTL